MQPVQGNKRKTRHVLRFHACVSILCLFAWSGTALAVPTGAPWSEVKRPIKHKKVSQVRKDHSHVATYKPGEPVYKNFDVVSAPAVPACGLESAAALEKRYSLKGWIIPTPRFSNSIFNDQDCWRTTLAKYGFGFMSFSNDVVQSNMLNHYVPPSGLQRYAGDRTTTSGSLKTYLTYDLSQWGVPDGQLQAAFAWAGATYINYAPNSFSLGQLAYYQTALNGHLEFNFGYIPLDTQFQGTQVGGNIANVLGPSSGIQILVGGSYATQPTPAAIVKWNIANGFYDKAAVSRSIATTAVGGLGNAILEEHYSNTTALQITNTPYIFGVQYPTERELFTNEVGYKTVALPGDMATWVRLDSYYNASKYENLQNPTTQTNNEAVQLFVDRQIWQSEPGSAETAYKGLYVGGTASYASPQANAIFEDFGLRAYTYGLFNRPHDMISLVWEHQSFSPYLADPVDVSTICLSGKECIRHDINTYSAIYTANIFPGVFVSGCVAYIDHPSSAWSPNALSYGTTAAPVLPQLNVNHSVNFLAAVHLNL